MESMKAAAKTSNASLAMSLLRVAASTVLVLLIPLVAMQFSDDVQWTVGDFVAAGVLLTGVGLAFELFVRKVSDRRHRLVLTVLLGLALVYLWAELAVGIFTHWGS